VDVIRSGVQADARNRLVTVAARCGPGAPALLAVLVGLTIPLKAARLDVAGLSLYVAFVLAGLAFVRYWRDSLANLVAWFTAPAVVLLTFAAWGVVRGAGVVGPTVTLGKLGVAFAVTAVLGVLTRRAEDWLYRGLLGGVVLTVVYMAYQLVSSVFFGFALPFTTSERWQIGLGLSSRYGLPRVTGFTEEPSFVATVLVGATLLNIAYAVRRNRSVFLRVSVLAGAAGLAMSTSNNLFATSIIIAAFWPFIRRRRVMLLFAAYYVVAVLVTPFVLTRDVTYYARFSAYDIFLSSNILEQLLGRGVGAYDRFFEINQVQFDGQDVASLASVWGAWLFEGGIALVALVIWWIAQVTRRAGWLESLSFIALLLMLSNYNSPWWPIVCLALAECLVGRGRRKDKTWTTKLT
jgi:hypothetical protein